MSKDLPYIIKETCFGNVPDDKNNVVSYNIWYAGDCVIIDYAGLVHLHTVISGIIATEKLDASSQLIVETLKKQGPMLRAANDDEVDAKMDELRRLLDDVEALSADTKRKGDEQ